jgi:4-hydroxybenzoate polyprenyltransferase
MRIHQWLKNSLLFLPMLAGHEITLDNLLILLIAFISFSFTASSIYLFNDLLDLGADREHPDKRFRPLAAGLVPLSHGVALSAGLLASGGGLAALVSPNFLLVVLVYCVVTSLYSFDLKRRIIVDVMTLAALYTLRIFAGSAAVGIGLSEWMLAFSMFLFLCLALVKRFTELKAQSDTGSRPPSRRSYELGDAQLILAQACAAGYASVVVLALYVSSPAVVELYTRPEGLWLVCALLLYWLTRVLLIAHRGSMHYDPVVFALKDRTSLATIAAVGTVILGSSTL